MHCNLELRILACMRDGIIIRVLPNVAIVLDIWSCLTFVLGQQKVADLFKDLSRFTLILYLHQANLWNCLKVSEYRPPQHKEWWFRHLWLIKLEYFNINKGLTYYKKQIMRFPFGCEILHPGASVDIQKPRALHITGIFITLKGITWHSQFVTLPVSVVQFKMSDIHIQINFVYKKGEA